MLNAVPDVSHQYRVACSHADYRTELSFFANDNIQRYAMGNYFVGGFLRKRHPRRVRSGRQQLNQHLQLLPEIAFQHGLSWRTEQNHTQQCRGTDRCRFVDPQHDPVTQFGNQLRQPLRTVLVVPPFLVHFIEQLVQDQRLAEVNGHLAKAVAQ